MAIFIWIFVHLWIAIVLVRFHLWEKNQITFLLILFKYWVRRCIYHGRQTDESSMSIFGEIGGVLTRVDDSIISGVDAGDRFG